MPQDNDNTIYVQSPCGYAFRVYDQDPVQNG